MVRVLTPAASTTFCFPSPPKDRLNKLGKLVKLSPDAARHAAARLPRLLALEPKEARQRLRQFGELVRVDDGKAAELAGRQPGLLLHSTETLRWACDGVEGAGVWVDGRMWVAGSPQMTAARGL